MIVGYGGSSAVQGVVAAGFEGVAKEFELNLATRGDIGAALAAVVAGRVVVDIWGGLADRVGERQWARDTVAGIFSGTKGLVSVCVLLLLERGLLDLDMPVCSYWPEFARAGKEKILVRHVVSHQAGMPGLSTPVSAEEATDDRRMAELLATQAPLWPAGTRLCYHPLTFGWLCGELVRRVDGRSIGRFFHEEVAGPMELDAWIGLPADQEQRVAVLEPGPEFSDEPGHAAVDEDHIAWSIWANPPRFAGTPLPANTRRWRAAEIPGTNGVASAKALARLYGCLASGGEMDGIRLLQPETLALAQACLSRGRDPYLGEELAFGVGFALQTRQRPFGPVSTAYGHNGAGGSVHGCWPDANMAFSYLPNMLRDTRSSDPRSVSLLTALRRASTEP